jgi:threonine synthase
MTTSTLTPPSSAKSSRAFFTALRCRECAREYPPEAVHVCEFCFGPLEVAYDYDAIGKVLTRERIQSRAPTMWRYKELLPVENEPTIATQVGFTPLVRADRLAKRLGLKNVWVKNDTVNHPTLSFKDRVVAVALNRAKELGFDTVACASTGNLANSVAANAASAGLRSYVFIPADLEAGKILGSLVFGTNVVGITGSYDEVNRLCAEIAGKYGWAFVNVNVRPFYAEGSKAMGFEIAEQLGWRLPDHVVVPMAGGSLITKIHKAFKEFQLLGFLNDDGGAGVPPVHQSKQMPRIHGAQAEGCAPIINAFKSGTDLIRPVNKPNTIVKSLAIGNPADGFYSLQTMKQTGGVGEFVNDAEVVEGIRLLAETEGIFAETAGGVTVGVAKKLAQQGIIKPDESLVLCITGHGLKTQEAVAGPAKRDGYFRVIAPRLKDFDALYEQDKKS